MVCGLDAHYSSTLLLRESAGGHSVKERWLWRWQWRWQGADARGRVGKAGPWDSVGAVLAPEHPWVLCSVALGEGSTSES